MNFLLSALGKIDLFTSYLKGIEKEKGPILVSGLSDVAKVHIVSGTKEYLKRPICIITYNEIQAKKLINDLKYFEKEILYFPKREIVTYDYVAESKDLPYERIEVLNKIQDKKAKVVVTTIEAVMQKLISKETLYKNCINLKVGKEISIEKLKEKLLLLGYERSELVESRGCFSVRGGIVDIALSEIEGIRIEFWGDEIDSIRSFKFSSQRSIDTMDQIKIYPAHEFILERDLDDIVKDIKERKNNNNEIQIKDNIDAKYINSFYKKQSSFLDYLLDDTLIFLDEDSKISQRLKNIIEDNNNLINNLIEKEKVVPDSIENIALYNEKIESNNLIYLEKQDILTKKNIERQYHFHYREVNFFKSETQIIIDEIKMAVEKKKKIVLLRRK